MILTKDDYVSETKPGETEDAMRLIFGSRIVGLKIIAISICESYLKEILDPSGKRHFAIWVACDKES